MPQLTKLLKEYLPLIAAVAVPVPVFLACLCFGSFTIWPSAIFSGDSMTAKIVELRAARLLCAFFVGGGLAVAGAALQAVLRNPLAEPFVLGLSSGASLGVVLVITTGLTAASAIAMPAAAFAGAALVLCLVLLMARGAGAEYANNLMLSGVVTGSVCSSILLFLISVLGLDSLHGAIWWMLGNLQPHNPMLFKTVAALIAACAVILTLLGAKVNALTLGEEMAYHLGLRPVRLILAILALASLATASAVAVSGVIGFVGLVVPHLLRIIHGADHRRLFPLCLVYGGVFLMLCDTIGRSTLGGAQEVPVGVVTTFVGGPFFLWLLNRRKGRE